MKLDEVVDKLYQTLLFYEMSQEEIKNILECSATKIKKYHKNEILFDEITKPDKLYVLVVGAVHIYKDSQTGKRTLLTSISQSGDLFGEVYLFLDKPSYDMYAQAVEDVCVLEFPKHFFFQTCKDACRCHNDLIQNMLRILSNKAYFLNKKLRIMSSGGLRQKLIQLILEHQRKDGSILLNMSREQLADYLCVARPSLSRELMKMQEDGLIFVKGKQIRILDQKRFEEEL